MTGWTRAELKSRAKGCLRIYYWPAFAVSLILAVVTGGWTSGSSAGGGTGEGYIGGSFELSLPELLGILMVLVSMLLIIIAVAAVVQIFIGNPLQVGGWRFFMESRARQESAGIGRVFWAFSGEKYGNVVKIMFLRDVKTLLWSLLLVVPGIIKGYEYRMIPLILSENPDMDSREAFALSREMMNGNKWAAFVLDLSFLGWEILAVIAGAILGFLMPFFFGIVVMIPVLFLFPYINATEAELYGYFRSRCGRSDLRGYGVPEVYNSDGSWWNG